MGEPAEKKARIAEVNDADLAKVVDDAVLRNSKTSTAFWLSVFESFCAEKDISIDLTSCSAPEFNDALSRFCLSMRTKEGGVYMKSSYLAARAALCRYVSVTLQRPVQRLQNSRASRKQPSS